MADKPLHCENKGSQMEAYEIVNNFHVKQSEFDGINSLLNWLEGYISAKGGTIPGYFELAMFNRTLIHQVYEQRRKKREEKLKTKNS